MLVNQTPSLTKKEKDFDKLETKMKELESKNEQLEHEVSEYKTKAQSKGRIVSKEFKEHDLLWKSFMLYF